MGEEEEEPIKNYMARDVIKFDYPPLELINR